MKYLSTRKWTKNWDNIHKKICITLAAAVYGRRNGSTSSTFMLSLENKNTIKLSNKPFYRCDFLSHYSQGKHIQLTHNKFNDQRQTRGVRFILGSIFNLESKHVTESPHRSQSTYKFI